MPAVPFCRSCQVGWATGPFWAGTEGVSSSRYAMGMCCSTSAHQQPAVQGGHQREDIQGAPVISLCGSVQAQHGAEQLRAKTASLGLQQPAHPAAHHWVQDGGRPCLQEGLLVSGVHGAHRSARSCTCMGSGAPLVECIAGGCRAGAAAVVACHHLLLECSTACSASHHWQHACSPLQHAA